MTETQRRILETLFDGNPHTAAELRSCLPDEMSTNVRVHISKLRKYLETKGWTIAYTCRSYRMTRLHCQDLKLSIDRVSTS